MRKLNKADLDKCVKRIPETVRIYMEHDFDFEGWTRLFIAGGFIRCIITGDKVMDIDVIGASSEDISSMHRRFGDNDRIFISPNAVTLKNFFPVVQLIKGWSYPNAEEVVLSHDFTVCGAAIFYNGDEWDSVCVDSYYEDVAARRLVYQHPNRKELSQGTLLRIGKYMKKGHHIDMENLAAIMGRMVFRSGIMDEIQSWDDTEWFNAEGRLSCLFLKALTSKEIR